MTDLAVPSWMEPRGAQATEKWHATVMQGGLVSSVVVVSGSEGCWSVRTQLRDRALRPVGEARASGPFSTQEEALRAGEAAASRLHKSIVGIREVPQPAFVMTPPPGGFQSQALRRYARLQQLQQAAKARPAAPVVVQPAAEAEKIA